MDKKNAVIDFRQPGKDTPSNFELLRPEAHPTIHSGKLNAIQQESQQQIAREARDEVRKYFGKPFFAPDTVPDPVNDIILSAIERATKLTDTKTGQYLCQDQIIEVDEHGKVHPPQPRRSEKADAINEARVVQTKCQRGVSGYGRQLYDNANELCADCYGTIGKLISLLEAK